MRCTIVRKLALCLVLVAIGMAAGVSASALPITVDAGENRTVCVGEEFTLEAAFSDTLAAGNRSASVDWGEGAGAGEMAVVSTDAANGTATAVHRYSAVGEFLVTVRVTNDQGSDGEDNLTVTVKPIEAQTKIVPNTLNLKSNGVFTVFLSLADCYSEGTLADLSNVLCGGAVPERVNFCMKDGGTYILKFDRQNLKNTTVGDAVNLNISGNVSGGTGDLPFAGTDAIRVTNPGKPQDEVKTNNGIGNDGKDKKVNPSFNPFKNSAKKVKE